MNRSLRALMVMAAPDESSLVLGELVADPRQPFRLAFQHDGDRPPEPVRGALSGFWVSLGGRPHVVFAGDNLDQPAAEHVLLVMPHRTQTCRIWRFPSPHHWVWMSRPEPFEAGAVAPGAVVTATWLSGDGTVLHEESTGALKWGVPVPPVRPKRPPPTFADLPSPLEDPDGWAGYSPMPESN